MKKFFRGIRYIIHTFNSYFYYNKNLNLLKNTYNDKRIILLCTPEHGNLGDHAIAFAQHEFLKKFFSKVKLIEITSSFYLKKYKKIKELINENDILIISGGGFLGSLWLKEENIVRDIIRNFKNNRIIIFPQTIFFEKNDFGEKELRNSKEIYSNHNKLSIIVRDRNSIEEAKKLVKLETNILYIPDIVLYLKNNFSFLENIKNIKKEKDILICLRKDKEKIADMKKIKNVIFKLKHNYLVKYTDTVINYFIFPKDRQKYIEKKLKEFMNSKLVITDRLHGMIFSYLAETPCIALNNSSGKVSGVYDWIKECNYIKVIEDIEKIEVMNDLIYKSKKNNINLNKEWNKLNNFLRSNFDGQN